MIKYVLHPDYVVSKSDGQTIFISYENLIQNYNLCIDECIRYDDKKCKGVDLSKLIHLYPLYSGDYIEKLKVLEIINAEKEKYVAEI